MSDMKYPKSDSNIHEIHGKVIIISTNTFIFPNGVQ